MILTARTRASLTATSQRCFIVQQSEDDPGEWDHSYDPKSTFGSEHGDAARLKQSWWISAPGRCSYWIKWPNASGGVRRGWMVRNVGKDFTPLLLLAQVGKRGPTFQPDLNYSEISSDCGLRDCAISFVQLLWQSTATLSSLLLGCGPFFLAKKDGALPAVAPLQHSSEEKWRALPSVSISFVVMISDTRSWWIIIEPSWARLILFCDETLQLQHRRAGEC